MGGLACTKPYPIKGRDIRQLGPLEVDVEVRGALEDIHSIGESTLNRK